MQKWFSFLKLCKKNQQSPKAINEATDPSAARRLCCFFEHFLVIHQDVFRDKFWVIWYFERYLSQWTYRCTDHTLVLQVNLITEGRLDHGTRLVDLKWFYCTGSQCEIHVICILPASTKGLQWEGRAVLYFVYRWIYGELLLIFILYFNCHANPKRILKALFLFFFFSSAQSFTNSIQSPDIYWWKIHFLFFPFFALHNSQAVDFLINQTSMMLY